MYVMLEALPPTTHIDNWHSISIMLFAAVAVTFNQSDLTRGFLLMAYVEIVSGPDVSRRSKMICLLGT